MLKIYFRVEVVKSYFSRAIALPFHYLQILYYIGTSAITDNNNVEDTLNKKWSHLRSICLIYISFIFSTKNRSICIFSGRCRVVIDWEYLLCRRHLYFLSGFLGFTDIIFVLLYSIRIVPMLQNTIKHESKHDFKQRCLNDFWSMAWLSSTKIFVFYTSHYVTKPICIFLFFLLYANYIASRYLKVWGRP